MTSAIATMITLPNDSATGTHERDASPFCRRCVGGWNGVTGCVGCAWVAGWAVTGVDEGGALSAAADCGLPTD